MFASARILRHSSRQLSTRLSQLTNSRPQTRMLAVSITYPPYIPDQPANADPPLDKVYPHGMKSMSKGTTVYDALNRLGQDFEEVKLDGSSPYVKPASVFYTMDGKRRRWDVVGAMASVGIVLYHTQLQCFLLVRQFRPAVYSHKLREAQDAGQPRPHRYEGFVYELCAGLADKADKPLKEIAREEIMEEVGYDVPSDRLVELGCGVSSAGTTGAPHYMYFATVDETMRLAGQGGGLQDHGECIEVLALPLEQYQAFLSDNSVPKSPGAMFGVVWGYHWVKDNLSKTQSSDNPNMTEELVLKPVLTA